LLFGRSPRLPQEKEALYTCDDILGDALCDLTVVESSVKVRGVDMFYWVYQKSDWNETSDSLYPVIMINGGPGYPHNYLLPMKQSACSGRKIIFYDQVGTGRSTICPPVAEGENPNACGVDEMHSYLITLEYYPEEVSALVEVLGLAENGYHVFGHSWGTVVAEMFAATRPFGLVSVVLGGALASAKVYIEAQWDPVEGNLGTLPDIMQATIKNFEEAEDFQNEAYLSICEDLTTHFTFRTFPAPECVAQGGTVFNEEVYVRMQGPSEFSITNSVMYDMDLSPELRNISVPVLLTNGKYDTMRGPNIRSMAAEIQNVEMIMFERSAHMTMIDQPIEMNDALINWWLKVEMELLHSKLIVQIV